MSLSIFSFEYFTELRNAFQSRKGRVIGMLVLLTVLLFTGMGILHVLFYFENFQTMAVRTLSHSTKIIGIGSSRMFFGVDPRRMPNGYMSLAANYLDMTGAERIWLRHKERIPSVQLALIEFGVSTLYYDMKALSPQALQPLGLDVVPDPTDFLTDFDKSLRLLLTPIFRWRLTPEFADTYKRMTHDPDEPHTAVAGHIPSRVKIAQAEFYAQRKAEQTRTHLANFAPVIFERNMRALLRLIKDLDQHGVRVIFIRFPKERHVWPVYDPAWDAAVKEAYAAVWGATGERIFLDLSRDPQFLTEEFRDPDHLNQAGAERLSTFLASKITDALY